MSCDELGRHCQTLICRRAYFGGRYLKNCAVKVWTATYTIPNWSWEPDGNMQTYTRRWWEVTADISGYWAPSAGHARKPFRAIDEDGNRIAGEMCWAHSNVRLGQGSTFAEFIGNGELKVVH